MARSLALSCRSCSHRWLVVAKLRPAGPAALMMSPHRGHSHSLFGSSMLSLLLFRNRSWVRGACEGSRLVDFFRGKVQGIRPSKFYGGFLVRLDIVKSYHKNEHSLFVKNTRPRSTGVRLEI